MIVSLQDMASVLESPSTNIGLPRDGTALRGVVAALACHAVFKHWEPTNYAVVSLLLIVVPSYLASSAVQYDGYVRGIFLTFVTYYVTLLASIALYRLSPFHPLWRYPGPIPCKLTKWWMLRQHRSGTSHLYVRNLHRRYGNVVRIGPNELSIIDPAAIQPMMGTSGLPKGPNIYGRALEPKVPSLLMLRDPAEHARRRKPWTRAFSTAGLKEFQPVVAKRIAQLAETLANRSGSPLDLAHCFAFFTYDLMGDMVFGGGSELMRDGDKEGVWGMVRQTIKGAVLFDQLPWTAHFIKALPLAPGIKKARAAGHARTTARYERGSTVKDLFYYLSNEDGAEKASPPPAQVLSDGNFAIVAGADTTYTVLSNVFWSLLSNPHCYKRLQAEIDKYYPQGEDSLNIVHHNKMVYLEAVINEALRLFPVAPGGSLRAPIPGKGDRICGDYYIPDGTNVSVHFWSLHRDPRNFSHPDSFYPDRWLIAEGLQESTENLVHNPNAYVPFSFGPANCVGKNLALMEMRTVLCHLMQKLEFRFADGYNPEIYEDDVKDFLLLTVGSLPVEVRRRD